MGDKIPAELMEALEDSAANLSRASALIKEGEALKEKEKKNTKPLMESFGVTTADIPGVGTMNVRSSGGSSINEKKLIKALLARGIDASEASEIAKESKVSYSYSYLEFKAVKSG